MLWTFPLGKGFGGAAVSKGKVYVLDRVGEQDVLRCIGLASGEEEWSFAYDAPGRVNPVGSRSVPAIDGNYVYTSGPVGHVHCIDTQTHKSVWTKNFWSDFGGGERLPMWTLGQNLLVLGDSVIVAAQTPEAGVVAFDKRTGDVQWKTPPFGARHGYVSPRVVSIGGEEQIVAVGAGPSRRGVFGRRTARGPGASGGAGMPPPPPPPASAQGSAGGEQAKGAAIGIDPKTGQVLWSYEGWQCQTPVPGVTAIGDGRLFVTGGYQAGSAMIKIEKKDGALAVTELYTTQAFGTHVHPAVQYEGHLYGHCTTNTGRSDGMVCMDLDGNVKWKTERSPLFDKGGFILADGLILSVDGREGILYLIEPDPQGFRKLASAKLLDTARCWAPLALVDGKLLIRDQEKMRCVAVR
ncbi:MAG: PQQ-binding-like beta-propeller repeat protein [Armatimonadota bacterium]